MAVKFSAGHRIHGYEIRKFLRFGQFADSYIARAPDGRDVFFKLYKTPSPETSWYRDFVRYQDKLSERLAGLPPVLVNTPLDVFEDDEAYYQVFERLEGQSLAKYFQYLAVEGTTEKDLELIDISAKLFMFAMRRIHDAGIVHSDLKPGNAFMVERGDTDLGRAVKVIDFDFSFFSDDPPPWVSRDAGSDRLWYVATDGYASPEYYLGTPPSYASDIFTCGVILYELFVGGSPHDLPELERPEFVRRYVEVYRSGSFESAATVNTDVPPHVSDIIDRMLAFDPADRPDAATVHQVLLARMPSQVNLLVDGGPLYKPITATTEIGQSDLRQFESYRYVSKPQFRIIRDEDGSRWLIEGLTGVTNNTRLNGEKITGRRVELTEGDVISVGPFRTTVQLKQG